MIHSTIWAPDCNMIFITWLLGICRGEEETSPPQGTM